MMRALLVALLCGCAPKLAPAPNLANMPRAWRGEAYDGLGYYAVDLVLTTADTSGALAGVVTMYGLSSQVQGKAESDGTLHLSSSDNGGAVFAGVWLGTQLAGGVRIPHGVLPTDVLNVTLSAAGGAR